MKNDSLVGFLAWLLPSVLPVCAVAGEMHRSLAPLGAASSDEVAQSDLQTRLNKLSEGTTLRLVLRNQDAFQGKYSGLVDDSIRLRLKGSDRDVFDSFALDDVHEVWQQRSYWKLGGSIGLLAGALVGAASADSVEDVEHGPLPLTAGALIGGCIGMIVGRMFHKMVIIYPWVTPE